MNITKLAAIAAGMLLLVVPAAVRCGTKSDPSDAAPALKPRASRILHLTGALDPRASVQLEVEYHTTAKQCRVTTNWLEGVYSDRVYRHRVDVTRNGNAYAADAPLDIVAADACRWEPFSINYTALVDGKPHTEPIAPTPLVWFRADAPASIAPFAIRCLPFREVLTPGIRCTEDARDGFLGAEAKALQVSFGTAAAAR